MKLELNKWYKNSKEFSYKIIHIEPNGESNIYSYLFIQPSGEEIHYDIEGFETDEQFINFKRLICGKDK